MFMQTDRSTLCNAGILEQPMRGYRTRRSLVSVVPARQATKAGGIDSLESIPLKKLKIPSQCTSLHSSYCTMH